jgi:peptide deformylase
MALIPLLRYPDPRLHKVSAPITTFDAMLQTLIDDMFDTMYASSGVGLAAPQINVHLRLAVMDIELDRKNQIVMINPEIFKREGEQIDGHGCLSLIGMPGDKIKRAAKVSMRALDRHGKPFEIIDAEQTLAICIQHEIDHLNGKLYVDHLSPLKRERLLKKGAKMLKNDDE